MSVCIYTCAWILYFLCLYVFVYACLPVLPVELALLVLEGPPLLEEEEGLDDEEEEEEEGGGAFFNCAAFLISSATPGKGYSRSDFSKNLIALSYCLAARKS